MSDLEHLSNDELAALATQWRSRALHGDASANGRAHELERELRRRSGVHATVEAPLEPLARRARWWFFWR
jgi:hypothetical protein